MAELFLIVRLAGERVALPAAEIESVLEVDGVTPVPGSARHVAGLAALRSRVLTAIDCRASLEAAPGASREAVVVASDGHSYALLVDAVEDVVEASAPRAPAAAPLGTGWSRVAGETVEVGGDLLLLVDPHALIAGPPARAAA